MNVYFTKGTIVPVGDVISTQEMVWTTKPSKKTLTVKIGWVSIDMTYEEALDWANALEIIQPESVVVHNPKKSKSLQTLSGMPTKGYVDAQMEIKHLPEPKADSAHQRIDILQKVLAEVFQSLSSLPGVQENVLKKFKDAEGQGTDEIAKWLK